MCDKVEVRMTSRAESWVIAGLTQPGGGKKSDFRPRKPPQETKPGGGKFHQKKIFLCPWEKKKKRGNRSEVKGEQNQRKGGKISVSFLIFRFILVNFSPNFVNCTMESSRWSMKVKKKWSIIVQIFWIVTINHKEKTEENFRFDENIVTFFFRGQRTHQNQKKKK